MFGAPRDNEDVTLAECHGPLGVVGVADGHVELAVENQKEFIGVLMDVPHMLTECLGDAHVVVVYSRNDPRAVDLVERRQGLLEVDRW